MIWKSNSPYEYPGSMSSIVFVVSHVKVEGMADVWLEDEEVDEVELNDRDEEEVVPVVRLDVDRLDWDVEAEVELV